MVEAALPGLTNIARGTPRSIEALQPREQPRREIPQIPGLRPKEELLIWQHKEELTDAVKKNDTVILAAGTGTGKTRGGSQIMLEALGPQGRMIVTENIRRATEESAKVVAADMKSGLGDEVGVRNRYTHDYSDKTRMLFCPVQSLLVMMENDPKLEQYDLIAMDEVHKESKANELCMIRLREIQNERRKMGKPLKLVFVSATADKAKIKGYFPGAKEVDVPGKTFPVDKKYEARDIPAAEIPKRAAEKVKEAIAAGDRGNILVFLSGKSQIEEAAEALGDLQGVKVIPYYSNAPKEVQDSLFAGSNERKIVLATNAAQEGLTLDINIVVDAGQHKHKELDLATGREYLIEQKAPRDHLTQREGRVGRKPSPYPDQQDKYYGLYTAADRNSRPEHEAAEMQRTDLTQEMLILLAQGNTDVYRFKYINPPLKSHIDIALTRLAKIGAYKDGKLTQKGRVMAELQIKPNLASMVVSGVEHGAVRQTAALAAMLEVFDYENMVKINLPERFRQPNSDATGFIKAFQEYHALTEPGRRRQWAQENGMDYVKLQDAVKLYDEIIRILRSKGRLNLLSPEAPEAFDRSLMEGFADSLVNKKYTETYIMEQGQTGVRIDRGSGLYDKLPKNMITLTLKVADRDGALSRFALLNHAIPEQLTAKPVVKAAEAAKPENKPREEAPAAAPAAPIAAAVAEPELPPPPPTVGQRIKSWFGDLWKRITG